MLKVLFNKIKVFSYNFIDTSYLRISSPELLNIVKTINKKQIDLMKEMNLKEYWVEKDKTDMEVRIAVLRSKLRYLPETFVMIDEILKNKNFIKQKNKKLNYFTPVFPMVHPAGEVPISKEILIHRDQINASRLFTIWTPITNYQYLPLSRFPFYFLHRFLPKWLHIFDKKFVKLIDAKLGDSLIWGGGFTHAGNPNDSQKLTTALVIRLLEQPNYEPCRLLNQGITKQDMEPKSRMSTDELVAFCKEFLKMVANNTSNKSFEYYFRVSNDFMKKKVKSPNQELGYCISMLGQRLRSNYNIDFFYAASLLISSNYLNGITHFKKKYKISNIELKAVIKRYDYLNIVPFDSFQLAQILGEKPSMNLKTLTF